MKKSCYILTDRIRYEVLMLSTLAFCLRFYRLGSKSLWLDEVLNVLDSIHSFAEIHKIVLAYPPLFHYILRCFYLVFGRSDFWLRIPSALFGTLTVPLIYWVAKRFYGDRAAFWAGFLMAVSVFDVLYSQEVRMYSLLALEALFSMYVWNEAVEKGGWDHWLAYGLATLLGLYTHNWFPFLVLAQGLWWVGVSLLRRSIDVSGIIVCLGIIILYIPWLFILKKQLALPVYGHMSVPGWSAIRETFYAFAGIRVPSGESWVGVGADARLPLLLMSLGFLFWGLFHSDINQSRAIRIFCVGCLLPVGTAFIISVLGKPIYLPGRYPIMGLPAYVLTVARGFQSISSRWRKKAAFLGGLWVVASLFTLGRYYWFYEKSPMKKVFEWIIHEAPTSEPIGLISRVEYTDYSADYYLAGRSVDKNPQVGKVKTIFLIVKNDDSGHISHLSDYAVKKEARFGNIRTIELMKSNGI